VSFSRSETADFSQLDAVPKPLFVLRRDAVGPPVYAAINSSALKLFDRPLRDFIGRTAADVFPGATGLIAHTRFCEAARLNAEVRFDLPQTLENPAAGLQVVLKPQAARVGELQYLYGCIEDNPTAAPDQANPVALRTKASEVEQFVAMAAHDLRAPMRNIKLLAEMLREDFADHGDGKLQLIDMLENVAAKSTTLIADVLAHAESVQPQTARPHDTRIFFGKLCRQLIEVLDPQDRHCIRVSEVTVQTDRTTLQIILRNLLDNALKHGGDQPLDIDISVVAKGTTALKITLQDNGSGFDAPAVVFLDGGELRVDSGYGLLGVRRLVAARGGTIFARNRESGGAEITFTLPGKLHCEPQVEQTAVSSTPAEQNPLAAPSARRTQTG